MTDERQYIPGVCNIGRAEVRLRWLLGWAGLAGTVALWAGLAIAGADPSTRLWVAAPALASAIGFLQAARGFCVKYGLDGVYSLGPKAGQIEPVDQAEYRLADRRAARWIIAQSLLIAAAVGAAAYWVPV